MPRALLLLGCLACLWPCPPARAVDNGGLGPLPIQDLFPPKLLFLNMEPEPVLTLPNGTFQITYQFALANTVANSQYNAHGANPMINQATVDQGLTTANFPSTGYGEYLDMETQHHTLRLRYGLTDDVEVGLDQSWVSFGGGSLDGVINNVEGAFNGVNPERTGMTPNQFHYYLVHNGKVLVGTSTPVSNVPQDPVLGLKWNLGTGGDLLPAFSIKLAYKQPLDSASTVPRALVSSGQPDSGVSLLFGKAVGRVVAHLQFGTEFLGTTHGDFVTTLPQQMFGLEYRSSNSSSLLLQLTTQYTIFNVGTESATLSDFALSRKADVASFGYKYVGSLWHFDLGATEDYNSRDNTTDIVLFLDLGLQW